MPDTPEDSPTPPPKPPPISLPTPDGFGDINQQAAVNREKEKANKKRRHKGERRHPKDPYEKLNKRGGCGSCLLILVVLILLPITAAVVWLGRAKTELTDAGFSWIKLQGDSLTLPPDGKAAYFAGRGTYAPSETLNEIAFAGGLWRIGGIFQEKVTFRGVALVLEPGTVMQKGLDVKAAYLETNGAKIEGDLSGGVSFQR